MMTAKHNKSGSRRRSRQSGFTLISSVVTFTVASVAMLGGWIAFRDMQMQWRVANAERMMDQYAHSTMSELVNVLTWSWGGVEVASGRAMRYNFAMMDMVVEHEGQRGSGFLSYPYTTDQQYLLRGVNGGMIQLTFNRDRGIMFDRQSPLWSIDARGRNPQYIWQGRNPRSFEQPAFDRRDRMSVVGFEVTRPLRSMVLPGSGDPTDISEFGRDVVYNIKMVIQYRYQASHGVSLFTDDYIRERTYSTTIFSNNWDVERNLLREDLLRSIGQG